MSPTRSGHWMRRTCDISAAVCLWAVTSSNLEKFSKGGKRVSSCPKYLGAEVVKRTSIATVGNCQALTLFRACNFSAIVSVKLPVMALPLRPLSPSRWNYAAAAHLLNRAGFGGAPSEIDKLVELGHSKAVDLLVNYESTPDPTLPPEWTKA